MYLGFDWLVHHNPEINWKKLEVSIQDKDYLLRVKAMPALPEGVPAEYAEYAKVFTEASFNQFPPERPWDHTIKFLPSAPTSIPARIYPLSPDKMKSCREFLDENLETGRIIHGESPITSPFFFIKKADGSLRPVMDYRIINGYTVPDHYPLPLIDHIIMSLTAAMIFTKLDIRWGFNNIRIRKEDQFRASFNTPFGTFTPTVMFFGLCNSPATFQRVMNHLFDPLLRTGCILIYIDDILIFTKDLESHIELVKWVLKVLEDNQLSLKPSKCDFHKDSVEYLGRLVHKGAVTIKPSHIVTIKNWPIPTTKTGVQRIVGLANYFRKFIPKYSDVIAPLTELTGNHPFKWEPEQQKALEALQAILVSQPVLKLPNNSDPLRVFTDASLIASGALLEQQQDNQWFPLAFTSKMFSLTERKYPTHDREMLAIIHALSEWRNILLSVPSQIIFFTDHIGLKFFKEPQNLSYRHARWSLKLADYRMNIAYVKGAHNVIADALSRSPIIDPKELEQDKVITLLPKGMWLPDEVHISRIIEDRDERKTLLFQAHDHILSGHPGVKQTISNLQALGTWEGLHSDVKEYVRRCPECQQFRVLRNRPHNPLNPMPPAKYPFHRISIDHIGPIPISNGFNTILVIVDFFTKFKILVACHTTDKSKDLAEIFVQKVFGYFGLPTEIVSDRGTTFVSKFTRALWKQLNIKILASTAYHPITNRQTERVNQEIEQYLRFYCNYQQDNWSNLLPLAQYTLNARYHSAVKATPFTLMFGYTPRWIKSTIDTENPMADEFALTLNEARENTVTALTKAAQVMKTYYDRNKDESLDLQEGDKVYLEGTNITPLRPMKKLSEKRYGPFVILGKIGKSAYKLKLPKSWNQVHPVFNEVLVRPFLSTD